MNNMQPTNSKALRYTMLFVISFLLFIAVYVVTTKWHDPHSMDFSIYWMAGRMILSGKNIYNTTDWEIARETYGLREGLEPWFHYPLPLAVLFTPISLFSIMQAYEVWVFFSLCISLSAILTLLNFYTGFSPRTELFIVAGTFLFRPVYIVFLSGQILSLLLLFVTLCVYLSRKRQWFWSGFVLSFVSLKPAFGLFILALMGIWYLFNKKWTAMAGIISGAIGLLLLGLANDPHWVTDYLAIGRQVFDKYLGMQTTVWGLASIFTHDYPKVLLTGTIFAILIVGVEIFALSRREFVSDNLSAMATVLPVALLVAPYSWSYDQFILILSIEYISIEISKRLGNIKAVLFVFLIDILAVALVGLAQSRGLDIWSLMISIVIWGTSLYFALSRDRRPVNDLKIPYDQIP